MGVGVFAWICLSLPVASGVLGAGERGIGDADVGFGRICYVIDGIDWTWRWVGGIGEWSKMPD
ncbi:hypothetical protein BU16DRAFT_530610 [Lophium mytilinum]|uniref:Uncharacterized protein n=1 Tax=Lophium mytilinum TaxID=390894 RepID=A0A6A6QHV5_9PEZI|nr:hypothetical protein BU16DRAFT_530610 [Lophium mytilinum]